MKHMIQTTGGMTVHVTTGHTSSIEEELHLNVDFMKRIYDDIILKKQYSEQRQERIQTHRGKKAPIPQIPW